ncbi:MAG: RND family transporter [Candidatus Bipolaricaulia bacterium]
MYRRYLETVVNRPKTVLIVIAVITLLFAAGLPQMTTDTDPEHMLRADAPVRVYNDQVEAWFDLQEMIVIGVANNQHEDGVLNADTLGRIYKATRRIVEVDGVVRRNVRSFPTTNYIRATSASLQQQRLLQSSQPNDTDIANLNEALSGNPLFENILVSPDRTTAAIHVPVKESVDAAPITDRIREILESKEGPESYYIGGERVAEDVFGTRMFQQMITLSPLVALAILIGLFLMFRHLRFGFVFSPLLIALVTVIWTMGLMIWLGIPIHIMSSMAPVFLMSIGVVDGIHILSEYVDQFPKSRNRRGAMLDTLIALKRPLLYTSLTTATGFASLYLTPIPPVKIFGVFVAFGILVAWALTITMVPALVMTLKERDAGAEAPEDNAFSRGLRKLGAFSISRTRPVVVGMVVALLVAGSGLTQIQINDSPVWWFKQGEDVREATEFLNDKLGGTSMLYVVAEGNENVMKEPRTLEFLEGLQNHLEAQPDVGKTTSLADLVKRINEAWHNGDPEYFQIPDSRAAIAQFLMLYLSSGRPSDLQDFVTHGSGYDKANVIVQLKNNGSTAMEDVVSSARTYLESNSLEGVSFNFAGPGYFNMRWNQEMFEGMMLALGSAALAVLLLLTLNFRSFKWGLVGFIPLGFTVLVTYGVLALLGVEFTMPIEVISALTLGMAVDFAIHFVQRFRERYDQTQELNDSILWTLGGSGVAILRNAVILFVGFLVLLFAPLTPYIYVGVFIAIIMALSSMATLFLLPAIIRTFAPALLGDFEEENQSTQPLEEVQP